MILGSEPNTSNLDQSTHTTCTPDSISTDHYVVILHGIFRSSRHMRKLAAYLCLQGYEVLNLDYPSTEYKLEELVEIIWQDISARLTQDKPVHFVGYSMGGLLVRAVLSKFHPPKLGRIVLLGTPNKGSEVADFLQNNYLYRKLYGPAGQQLITDQSSIQHLFKPVDYELGIIAGSWSIDPISSFLIKGNDDGKVSIQSTKLEGMQDHIIIPTTHTWFPHNKEVQRQTAYFLQDGTFNR